jgi:dihydroneopterin aldolase/2-amino-4-hydroxy-6-hydroxymethyldihydropteridine diphosphokinase/dihydropteroate synthase
MTTTAILALGSNLGKRAATLRHALTKIGQLPGTRVVRTSFLYQTQPCYVLDQPAFLNAACAIKTSLPPYELMSHLQRIEKESGRTLTVRNGPRTLDLDILMYADTVISSPTLTLPHPMLERRQFVLVPLCDLAEPDLAYSQGSTDTSLSESENLVPLHPINKLTPKQMLARLVEIEHMPRVFPMRTFPSLLNNTLNTPSYLQDELLWTLDERTHVMGILNLTPDSFSDGGKLSDLPRAVAHAQALASDGADLLDLGGVSTRPGVVAMMMRMMMMMACALGVCFFLVPKPVRGQFCRRVMCANGCLYAQAAFVSVEEELARVQV